MGRSKEINNCVQLSFVVSQKQVEQLRRMALRMSSQEGCPITVVENSMDELPSFEEAIIREMPFFVEAVGWVLPGQN